MAIVRARRGLGSPDLAPSLASCIPAALSLAYERSRMTDVMIEASGLGKEYGSFVALKDASFELRRARGFDGVERQRRLSRGGGRWSQDVGELLLSLPLIRGSERAIERGRARDVRGAGRPPCEGT